jgi:hypothetical protein
VKTHDMSTVFQLRGCPEAETFVEGRRLRSCSAKTEYLKRRARELDYMAHKRCSYFATTILRQNVEIPKTADRCLALVGIPCEPTDRNETAIKKATQQRFAIHRKPIRTRLPFVDHTSDKPEAFGL